MKKYFRRGNPHIARHIGILVVCIIAVVLLRHPSDGLRSVVATVTHPVFAARSGAEADSVGLFGLFQSKTKLAQDNQRLEKKVRNLELQLLNRNVLKKENAELKALFGRTGDRNYTLAAVLNRPDQTPYDTVVIDSGSALGVSVGDNVFESGDVGIGVVESVTSNTSLVRLYSSPGMETEVFFPGSDVAVTAEGIGGGNFIARLPEGISINVGDEVIAPGVETTLVGVVGVIERESGDLFQTVRFRSPANTSGLRFVLVENSSQK